MPARNDLTAGSAGTPGSLPQARALRCSRSEKDLPLEDPRCPDPAAYCRWRAACTIHVLEKEGRRSRRQGGAAAEGSTAP